MMPGCERCIDSPWGAGTLDDPLASACGGRPFRDCDCLYDVSEALAAALFGWWL